MAEKNFPENPKIMVLGAGAIGSLFGGLLADAGNDVTLVGRAAHVNAIKKNGLRISGLTEKVLQVKAATKPVKSDFVLLTVKSYDTETAARMIPLGKNTVVMNIQNGLGNVEKIADAVGLSRTLGGITSHGSLHLAPGHIKHTGIGYTTIGELDGVCPNLDADASRSDRGKTKRVERIAEIFNDAGIETKISEEIKRDIWVKLIVNAGINALTALAGVKNGMLLEIPEMKESMRLAVEEATLVAGKSGIRIDEDTVKKTEDVARLTKENESSMLQDVKKRKKTEIDAINGAVAALGKKLGVETPVNMTLYALVRGKEEGYRKER
jgi:2-dehydropantoate 2-reductase